MANDIAKAVSSKDINNGNLINYCSKTGIIKYNDAYTKHTPTLNDIENKYDNRFDDPSYYYGCNPDGGNV